MTTALTTFQAQVEILLGDDANTELSDHKIREMVKAAVERYSRDKPDEITEDESGDGGIYYDVANLLASWVEDFSRIISVQYPAEAITDDSQPQYLENDDWNDNYWQGGTRYLLFNNVAPASGDTFRVTYTAPYTLSSNDYDTPTQDFYAICNLAAGLCCMAIATKFSRTSDATIAADSVNHTPRSSQFSARAKQYIGFYEEHMGLGSDDGKPPYALPAGAFIDFDTAPSWQPGRQFLFHSKGTR